MNTTKQMVTENSGNFTVPGSLVSRARRETPGRAPAANARKKHHQHAAFIFLGIALVAYPLVQALAGLPRQEFEGLGVAACFFIYVGIFLWRVSRALTQDSLQAETSNGAVTQTSESNPSQEENTATQFKPERK
jgi:hypothetical protein